MNQNIQTIETNLVVTRDAQLDKDYVRKQARKAFVNALKRDIANMYASFLEKAEKGWIEFKTPIVLDYIDWQYGTSLRKQYFAGKRTQAILSIKRQYLA